MVISYPIKDVNQDKVKKKLKKRLIEKNVVMAKLTGLITLWLHFQIDLI